MSKYRLICRSLKVYVSVFGDVRGKEVAISGFEVKSRTCLLLITSQVIEILDGIKDESEKGNADSRGDDDHESWDQSDDVDWESDRPR